MYSMGMPWRLRPLPLFDFGNPANIGRMPVESSAPGELSPRTDDRNAVGWFQSSLRDGTSFHRYSAINRWAMIGRPPGLAFLPGQVVFKIPPDGQIVNFRPARQDHGRPADR